MHTHAHHHVAELRQGRVGQDAFDVVLLDGDDGGEQSGEAADAGDDPQRVRAGNVQQEKHAAKHIHARGHHGCRMNQRADGRRPFHRVGQPDVQRELGALAHRAAEDQQPRRGCERAQRLRVGLQIVFQHAEVERAERGPDCQDAEDEPEIAETIYDESLLARVRRRGPLKPETDQQVAGDTDQFPENEQGDKIVRQNDAEHRKGEQT